MDDELLAAELQAQVQAAQEVVRKLETEIRETMEGLELQTASTEARRLRADRATASLQREQGQMVTAGKKHAALIVKWWLWGSLLGWLLAIIVSVLVSPVLGFIVFVPVMALFLLFGYASSSVEMKVDIANVRKESRARVRVGSNTPEIETEEFIGQILGDAYYYGGHQGPGGGAHYRRGNDGGGDSAGGVVRWVGGLLYGAGAGVVGASKWLLGYGGGGGGHAKAE